MSTDQQYRGAEKDSTEPKSHKARANKVEGKPSPSGTFELQRTVGNQVFGRVLQEGLPPNRKAIANGTEAQNSLPSVVRDVLRSPGQPLDPTARADMESHFGHDFSRVRIHIDSRAAESARTVNAQAYTVGQDLVFAEGKFHPNTDPGRGLLAHELTHTIQQGKSGPSSKDLRIDDNENTEREATRGSDAVRHGSSFRPQLRTTKFLARQGGSSGASTTAPATSEKSGEEELDPVWVLPPGVRRGAVPIYDSEETRAVIGFKYSSSGFWQVFDLEGKLVETGEIGLEQPLIDPIDIVAGLLTGGLFSGGRAAARGLGRAVTRTAAETATETAAETGVRAVLRTLSKATLDTIRATYRALRFRGALNFTETTAARMADPARRIPQYILRLAIKFGTRTADPQEAPGAFRYLITMFRNGKPYTLEVVLREADQTILHFLYK